MISQIAACLLDELQAKTQFTRSAAALELLRAFRKELTAKRAAKDFETTMSELAAQPVLAFEIALEWITALNPNVGRGVLSEAAAMGGTVRAASSNAASEMSSE